MLTTLFDGRVLGVRVVLDAYPTMLWAGALGGIAIALLLARTRGLALARAFAVLASAAVSIPIGARALQFATDPSLFLDGAGNLFALSLSGFALYGGLIVAVVVGAVLARVLRVDLWRLADAAAPGIAFGLVCARIGCFCEGCCQGIVTSGPLGVAFPTGSPAHAAQMLAGTSSLLGSVRPVYATQLLEGGGALVFGVLAWWLGSRSERGGRVASGVAFLTLAAGFSAVRWAVYPLRWVESAFVAPRWTYPVLYAGLIALCVGLAVLRTARLRREA